MTVNALKTVTENNVMRMLAEIEKKLKFNERILEHYLNDEENIIDNKEYISCSSGSEFIIRWTDDVRTQPCKTY